MLRRAGLAVGFVHQGGEVVYLPTEMKLFQPETPEEIALGMFVLQDNEKEILLFRPQAIHIQKDPIPENIPEEPEYPEIDR